MPAARLRRIRDCRVGTLAVHPDFQGRGISRRRGSSLAWEAAKAGYRPEAMADTFEMFKRGENFEIARARAEGREPTPHDAPPRCRRP